MSIGGISFIYGVAVPGNTIVPGTKLLFNDLLHQKSKSEKGQVFLDKLESLFIVRDMPHDQVDILSFNNECEEVKSYTVIGLKVDYINNICDEEGLPTGNHPLMFDEMDELLKRNYADFTRAILHNFEGNKEWADQPSLIVLQDSCCLLYTSPSPRDRS